MHRQHLTLVGVYQIGVQGTILGLHTKNYCNYEMWIYELPQTAWGPRGCRYLAARTMDNEILYPLFGMHECRTHVPDIGEWAWVDTNGRINWGKSSQ
jgi:hypothetical protein